MNLMVSRQSLRYNSKALYILSLGLYLFCLPLDTINFGFGSILKLIAIIPIGIALISNIKYLKFIKLLKYQVLFTLFAGMSILWSVNPKMSLDREITYVLLTILLYSGSVFTYTKEDIERIKRFMLWSSRSTAVIVLLSSEFKVDRFVVGGKFSFDPNYLCGYLFAGLIICLSYLFDGKRKKAYPTIELLLYISIIILTGSRGGLIAGGTAILVFLFIYNKNSKNKLSKNINIILVILFILLLSVVLFNFLPKTLIARFNIINAIVSGGTGRRSIWEQGIKLFSESSLSRKMFGQGTGAITAILIVYEYNSYRNFVMHNIFLETLVELGIIGLVLYISNIYSFVKKSYRFEDKFSFCVLAGMIVLSLTTSLHTFKPYFNIMLFIIISSNVSCREEK